MAVSSPYVVFRADPSVRAEPDLRSSTAAVQPRTIKPLESSKTPATWSSLIQGNLFDPRPPL